MQAARSITPAACREGLFGPNCVKNPERSDMLRHIMNAKERSSAGKGRKARSYCPGERALRTSIAQRAQERLPRDADENWTAKNLELIEASYDLDVLRRGLSKCDPGSRMIRARGMPAFSANVSE
jgi:hypothetical protein